MKKIKIRILLGLIMASLLNLENTAEGKGSLFPIKIEKFNKFPSKLLNSQISSDLQNRKIIMNEEKKTKKVITFKEYNENYSRYQILKSENYQLEIKMDQETFNHTLDFKNKHFKESPTDYCLTNMIGEDMESIKAEDVENLSKPLIYSHLLWDLYWSFGNGGFSLFIEHYNKNNVFGIVEALNEIGLKKEAEALKKVIIAEQLKMKEKFGKIIDFRTFHDTLIKDEEEYDAFRDQFEDEFELIYDSLEKLYIYGDKYLEENKDKFII